MMPMSFESSRESSKVGRLVLALAFAAIAISPEAPAQQPLPVRATFTSAVSRPLYVNETFTMTLAIESVGLRLGKTMEILSLPDSRQLVFKEFKELPMERRVDGGRILERRRFQCEVNAVAPGTVQMRPALRIGVLTGRPSFFSFAEEETSYDVPVSVPPFDIYPLPEQDRPPEFAGAIGRFSMEATLTPTNVAVGSLVTVGYRFRGTGDLSRISPPVLEGTNGFRIYDPRAVDSGPNERHFEQVMVPLSLEARQPPRARFAFFDPDAGRYERVERNLPPLVFTESTNQTPELQHYRPASTSSPMAPSIPASDSPRRHQALRPTTWMILSILLAIACFIVWSWPRQGGAAGKRRRWLTLLGVLLLAALVVSGYFVISRGLLEPEIATSPEDLTAHLAPALSGKVSFHIPAGEPVRLLDVRGKWAKVAWGEKRGWVLVEGLQRRP